MPPRRQSALLRLRRRRAVQLVRRCGNAFVSYYVLATRGPWRMAALRLVEGATRAS